MRSLNDILAALDISDQISRGLILVRQMDNPIACLVLALILAAINVLLWPWIWYFDIDATRAFGEAHAPLIHTLAAPVPLPDPAMMGTILAGGLLLPAAPPPQHGRTRPCAMGAPHARAPRHLEHGYSYPGGRLHHRAAGRYGGYSGNSTSSNNR